MKAFSLTLGVVVIALGGVIWVQQRAFVRLTSEFDVLRSTNLSLVREVDDLRRQQAAARRDATPSPSPKAVSPPEAPPAPPPRDRASSSLTPAEERKRRLEAVNSRETALAFLALFTEHNPIERMKPEDRPKFRLLGDDDLTEEERTSFAGVRESAAKEGGRIIFMRVEGSPGLQILNSGGFDTDSLPARVREFLTESDLRKFQDEMLFMQAENTLLRNSGKLK